MIILITGAFGFVGKEVRNNLLEHKHTVITLGIESENDLVCDLRNEISSLDFVDIVIHIAGKAHSNPKSPSEKELFFEINFQGTKNLCDALDKIQKPKSFIFISTVAVYGVISGLNISEDHPLNGHSPYALSKIQAEEYLQDWCEKNNVKLGILRPSLIAGKNPPGNLGAMINGIKSGKYLRIGKSSARKSILMAEDVARLIPKLVEVGGVYNVCDNHHPSFAELEETISKQLNKKLPISIPLWVAKFLGIVGDIIGNKFPINSNKLQKIIQPLTFSIEKAKRELDWEPIDVLSNFKIF
jgi:GlcNAc-P-P-Und epimerase